MKKALAIGIVNNMMRILALFCAVVCTLTIVTGCGRSAEVKKVKIDDIEIAYYIRGKGKPLVMVMGFRGTMALWDPALLEELEKYYTLILFDNRGMGLSTDSIENQTTIPQMAEDTARLIKALGYEKANLLGWSMGSRIAQYLAITQPEIVEKLILCSPNPGGSFQATRRSDAYKQLTTIDLSKKEGLSLIFPETDKGRKAADELVRRLSIAVKKERVPNDFTVSDLTVERQKHALHLWDQNDENYQALITMRVPTLVAGGLADTLDSPENVRIVASRIPFAWVAYFPDAGHDFLSQEYQQSSLLIRAFLQ